MKVSKPISTITYNTIPFLISTLNAKIKVGDILYYEFIEHLPDEDGKKKHIHLYIIPNRPLDLSSFADEFEEKDPQNEKPLKPQGFRKSNKYGDWYWYSLHDKDYLKAKGLKRNVFYNDNQIITSNDDIHYRLVAENPLQHFAMFSDIALRNLICEAVYNGVSLESLLSSDFFPIGKVQSCVTFYRALEQCIAPQQFSRPVPVPPPPEELKNQILQQKINKILSNPIQCSIDDLPFKDDLF